LNGTARLPVVRQWLLPAVLMGLCGGAIGALLAIFVMPRRYTASASLLFPVRVRLPATVPGTAQISQGMRVSPYQLTMPADVARRVLESRTVRERIVRKLGLVRLLRAKSAGEAAAKLAEATTIRTTEEGVLKISVTLRGTPRGLFPKGDEEYKLASARVVNEYIHELQKFAVELARSVSRAETRFLRERLEAAERRLREVEREAKEFAKRTGLPPSSGGGSPLAETLKAIEQMEAETRGELARVGASLKAASGRLRSIPRTTVSQQTESLNPALLSLSAELAKAEVEYEVAERTYGPKHPDVRAKRAKVKELRRRLKSERERVLQSIQRSPNPLYQRALEELLALRLQAAGLRAKLGELRRARAMLAERVKSLSSLEVEGERLRRKLSLAEQVYRDLRMAYENARTASERPIIVFHVIDWAEPPTRKSGPGVLQWFLIGAFIGGGWTFVLLLLRGVLRE